MRNVRKISKKYYVRQIVACLLIYFMLLGMPVQIALAGIGDDGYTIVAGTPDIDALGGNNNASITLNDLQTIINWQNFNTIDTQTVQFLQKISGNPAVLNKILGGATTFDGSLFAKGIDVFLVNSDGITFGPTAYVTARNLVASSLNMSDTDFTNGIYKFTDGLNAKNVTNNGTIVAENMAALIGKQVFNTGHIAGKYVVMAAGETVTIIDPLSDNVAVKVDIDVTSDPAGYKVTNDGDIDDYDNDISVDTKHVILAAGDIWSTAIDGIETLRAEAIGSATFTGDIHAYADDNSDSDAVADVTIITGEDFTVDNEITATATSSDDLHNASANIEIVTGGNLNVLDKIEAKAQTRSESTVSVGNLTANVVIDAEGDVTIGYEGEPIDGHIMAVAKTGDYSGGTVGNISAKVDIDAENVTVEYGNIGAVAKTGTNSWFDAGDITSTVEIDTDGDLTVYEYSYTDESLGVYLEAIEAHSEAGSGTSGYAGDVTATVDIGTGGNVVVDGGTIEADAEVGYQCSSASAEDVTATVDIDTVGDLTVKGDGDIWAHAHTSNESSGDAGDMTAKIDIDAGGNVNLGDDEDYGDLYAEAYTGSFSTGDVGNLTSTIKVNAGGDVTVTSYTYVDSAAYTGSNSSGNAGNLTATIDIDAVGNVSVIKSNSSTSQTRVYAYAQTGDNSEGDIGNLNAAIDIDAGGNVTVNEYSYIEAAAGNNDNHSGDAGSASAKIDISADGDVVVGNGSEIYANAQIYTTSGGYSIPVKEEPVEPVITQDATAEVAITAGGQVTIQEQGYEREGGIYADADLYIENDWAYASIEDNGDYSIYVVPGDATANITILADGDVTSGTGSEIEADAYVQYYCTDYAGVSALNNDVLVIEPSDASASVDIQTCGDLIVNGMIEAYAEASLVDNGVNNGEMISTTSADIAIRAYGDVIVNQLPDIPEVGADNGLWPDGGIVAQAQGAYENSADVTILARGSVTVNDGAYLNNLGIQSLNGDYGEEIRANASYGYTNNASIGIASRYEDVIVSGQIGAHSSSWTDVESTSTSTVEVSAGRDVIVNAGWVDYVPDYYGNYYPVDGEPGGMIMAEAIASRFNTANVDIFADRDVTVHGADVTYLPAPVGAALSTGGYGYGDPGGQIMARAGSGDENNARIGIYAGRDVTVNAATVTELPPDSGYIDEPGGWIHAQTDNGYQNTSLVQICAAGDVTIDGDVEASAWGEINKADVKIAAGGVIAGNGGIYADPDYETDPHITFFLTDPASDIFNGDLSFEPETVIGPVDCPDCDFDWIDWTWCADCEQEEEEEPTPIPLAPPAPLYTPQLAQGGCPGLMQWLANEIGVPADQIQVAVAGVFALNTDIQPCDMCARLAQASITMQDPAGTKLAALTQVINEFVATPTPPSPEQMTSIAAAFAEHVDDRTHYADAGQLIDAIVAYISIMRTEMGFSMEDATGFAEKYMTPINEAGNAALTAYVNARIAALEG